MKLSLKNLGFGSFMNLIAAVLGLVGLIAMLVSNNIDTAYALKSVSTLTLYGILGVALLLVAIWSPTKFGNHDYISSIANVAAIALFMAVVGPMILDRILMIAGLFSYNSQNATGWRVFSAVVVSAVAYVLACVFAILGSFTKSVRNQKVQVVAADAE